MLHRVILGAVERFLGVLIEHTAGALPAWLAPVQARILIVTDAQKEFAVEALSRLRAAGIRAELDDRNEKLGFKVREAQMDKIPYMAVLPPSYRLDLEREADLIEEVGRVYGLDRIAPRLPRVSKSLTEDLGGTEFGFLSKVRRFAAASGLREAVIYSFVGHADLDLLGVDPACRVSVANPLSEDQNVMGLVGQPDGSQGLKGTVLGLGAGHTAQIQGQPDVFHGIQGRKQVVALEDEPDMETETWGWRGQVEVRPTRPCARNAGVDLSIA